MSVKITWLGHAAFSLEFDGRTVLIDPFLTGNPLASIKPDELKPDVIFVSHDEGEHQADVVSIARHSGAEVLLNYTPGKWQSEGSIEHLIRIQPGQTYETPFADVLWTAALPDKNTSGEVNGFVIATDKLKLYYAGKTHLFNEMADIGDLEIDLAFLPIGGAEMMTPKESLKAIERIRPRLVIPTHHTTFPEIVQDVGDWANNVNSGTVAKPIVLDPGGTYTLA